MKFHELEYPYNKDWDKGWVITQKKDGRKILKLKRGSKMLSTQYARYLMAVKLGRYLTKDEEVDHIDNDCTNNSLDNLQILTRSENVKKEHFALHPLKHGSNAMYRKGCRCDLCRKWKADYIKKWSAGRTQKPRARKVYVIEGVCEFCGQPFKRETRSTKLRFCSRHCATKSRYNQGH